MSTPRLLLIKMRINGCGLAFMVGHAVDSSLSADEAKAWWAEAKKVASHCSLREVPFVCAFDANATACEYGEHETLLQDVGLHLPTAEGDVEHTHFDPRTGEMETDRSLGSSCGVTPVGGTNPHDA